MLTPVEKVLFIILALFTLGAAYEGFRQMYLVIHRGEGELAFDVRALLARLWQRLRYPDQESAEEAPSGEVPTVGSFIQRGVNALAIYLTQRTTLRSRRITSLFHLGVVLGFTFYFLVNALDLLIGFFDGFDTTLQEAGFIYDAYKLVADVLSVIVIVGMVYLIIRRLFLPSKKELEFHDNVLLHPKVKAGGVTSDSMIVAVFILLHIGSRFLGEAVHVAEHGADLAMPFATITSPLFAGFGLQGLEILSHMMWWIALGGILLFLPYLPYTKHAHLFMAPLNYLTRPKRTSLGELEAMDFEDEEKEQFGANRIEDLTKTQLFDAYACIMCNRCQDVCPAYTTGKELSPSALEVNKRFYLKDHQAALAYGGESDWSLMGSVISESAVWACTSCGACVDICPVGNEPMFDILDIRRDAVLTQGEFPAELQGAFNGMERQGNPWQIGESRVGWTTGLDFDVPTIEENPNFDVLYWTGCAVSYDPRAQETAQALVKVLRAANVNYAILGDSETCTGDTARRAGNEYLYFEMASANVETLNEVNPKRIVVTCPHCFHNIGKEYHQFGGNYEVVHHTELIEELIAAGKLPQSANPSGWGNVTFHDPCYLGRQNDVVDAPRNSLKAIGAPLIEMPRNKKQSFCCGAGGAQFWKEEEHGTQKVNIERYNEAKDTGAETLAVGCPFCMRMFVDAQGEVGEGPDVKDVVELIAERL